QERSRAIATELGDRLPALVESGKVLLGIDRAYSRQLLCEANGTALLAMTGIDLRSEMRLTKFCHLAEVPLIGTAAIAGFFAWGWWGLLWLPVLALVFFLGSMSNVTSNGSISYVV